MLVIVILTYFQEKRLDLYDSWPKNNIEQYTTNSQKQILESLFDRESLLHGLRQSEVAVFVDWLQFVHGLLVYEIFPGRENYLAYVVP
jgi:hypothetical protein